jgi:hypothetical protein
MFEPTRETLEYWGLPDLDAPLPLARCPGCGGIVCRCARADDVPPELDEAA